MNTLRQALAEQLEDYPVLSFSISQDDGMPMFHQPVVISEDILTEFTKVCIDKAIEAFPDYNDVSATIDVKYDRDTGDVEGEVTQYGPMNMPQGSVEFEFTLGDQGPSRTECNFAELVNIVLALDVGHRMTVHTPAAFVVIRRDVSLYQVTVRPDSEPVEVTTLGEVIQHLAAAVAAN